MYKIYFVDAWLPLPARRPLLSRLLAWVFGSPARRPGEIIPERGEARTGGYKVATCQSLQFAKELLEVLDPAKFAEQFGHPGVLVCLNRIGDRMPIETAARVEEMCS